MSLKIKTLGNVTVSSAGTAVSLDAANVIIGAPSIIIAAAGANIGNIYIGDSTVDSTNGIILSPGAQLELDGSQTRNETTGIKLSQLFVDSDSNGAVAKVSILGQAD